MPIRARPFRARHLSLRARRSRRLSCWEKSCWLASRPCTAAPTGTPWSPVGRRCSPRSPHLSILVGNLVALAQTNVRRLLAYSAVAHAGYTLLGLVAGGRDGFSATLFYTTIYAITLVGAFGVVALVRRETGGDDFQNFAGLARAFAVARRLHGDLHAFAGRHAAAGRILRQILPLQRRAGRRRKSRPALAGRARALGSLISLYYYLIVLKVFSLIERPRLGCQSRLAVANLFTLLALLVLFLGITPEALVARIIASLT